jgi:hypothetical protein
MGTILFTGDPPYQLIVTRGGKATAKGENVMLALPVSVPAPDPAQEEQEVELLFRFGYAFGTASTLQKAANEARKGARGETE